MIPAEIIAEIALLGLTADQAKAVASMLTRVEQATEARHVEQIEANREKKRAGNAERQRRFRINHPKVTVNNASNALQSVTERYPSPEVSPKDNISNPLPNPTLSSLRSDISSERKAFAEKLWRVIPKRRGDSFKPFEKAVLKALADGAKPEAIIDGAVSYARSEEGGDAQFRKGAAVWINNHGWTADWSPPARPQPPPKSGSGGGWAKLMADHLRHGDENGKSGNPENVSLLPLGSDDGSGTGCDDGGSVLGNRAKLLIGDSVRRM